MFGDCILKGFESILFQIWRCRGVCEGEDILGKREVGIFGVLGIGPHGRKRRG